MKNFKFKLLLPVLAIVFAMTSAFTTSANSNVDEFAAPQQAYILNNNICVAATTCSPQGSFACTIGGQNAYGLSPSGTTCNVALRKNTP